jgi:hypothetical protein
MNDDQPDKQPAVNAPETPQPPLPPPADSFAPPPVELPPIEPVEWSASEFIVHKKGQAWYAILAALAGVAAVLGYLFTKDVATVVGVVIAAVFMGVFAGRKPRNMTYKLDASGLHIVQQLYPYSAFKSFSVIDEGTATSITLMPLKRFMPSISMYYDQEDEERILNILSIYLPFEERQRDAVDALMHKIRF